MAGNRNKNKTVQESTDKENEVSVEIQPEEETQEETISVEENPSTVKEDKGSKQEDEVEQKSSGQEKIMSVDDYFKEKKLSNQARVSFQSFHIVQRMQKFSISELNKMWETYSRDMKTGKVR